MAITNVGFTGPVTAVEFARMSQHQGSLVPVVCGRDDLAVAANPSVTLTCTVAPGSSAGQGVMTTSSATESVTFGAVSTPGQTRWDAVVLRRNWASSGSASFVVVAGSAAASAPMVLPSGVDLTLDSTHDQVLALVQIAYGNTVPTQVVDRRLQGSKVFTAPALSALPAASSALYGMEADVAGVRYRCISSGGSLAWVTRDATVSSGVLSPEPGWSVSGATYTRKDQSVGMYLSVVRTGAPIVAGTGTGDISNVPIGTLTVGTPKPAHPCAATVYGGPLASVALTTTGQVDLAALQQSVNFPTGGYLSLCFTYVTND